ncbi:glycoside hydrolase superfamily [Umbelopsis sp. AD052]|nr:glycoside hydrolase superfamily [Umbelopsis sp. AD052]
MKISIAAAFVSVFAASALASPSTSGKPPSNAVYKNPHASVEARVKDLLSRMTWEEKQAQLIQGDVRHYVDANNHVNKTALQSMAPNEAGAMFAAMIPRDDLAIAINATQSFLLHDTRLGIPSLMQSEGIHGYLDLNGTLFTSPLGFACSFNPDLVEELGDIVGSEAESMGVNNIFAPVLDLSRELRWGRVEENYGEDPHLTGELGYAFVTGLQGSKKAGTGTSAKYRVASMVKHFVAFGSPEGGLNTAPVAGGERDLRSLYLPPFKRAIKDAGALSIMSAYHSYDGVPAAANSHAMNDVLRGEWDFQGFVSSDAGAIDFLCSIHHICETSTNGVTNPAPAIIALNAGNDMEMAGSTMHYLTTVDQVKKGNLKASVVDEAVSRILRVKFLLGLFENPWTSSNYNKVIHSKANVEFARKVDEESIVLLENDGTLPISESIESIAVIGPQANVMQYGDYVLHGVFERGVTPLAGIQSYVGKSTKVNYAEGCKLWSNDESEFKAAVKAAKKSKVAVVMVGTWSRDQNELWQGLNATTGEHVDVNDLALVGAQLKLVKAIQATGTPTVVVYISGKPIAEPWIKDNVNAVVQAFYPGEQGGNALANILFGKVNPSGKLSVSFPTYVGSLPSYYNYNKGGRSIDPGHIYANGTLVFGHQYVLGTPVPMWLFGHGLSYTTFTYESVKVAQSKVSAKASQVEVEVKVKNSGKVDGQEVVQVYINDVVSSVVTPVMALKGFKKVAIKAGKTVTVKIPIKISELALWAQSQKYVVEPGVFQVYVGGSAETATLATNFTVY